MHIFQIKSWAYLNNYNNFNQYLERIEQKKEVSAHESQQNVL